MIDPLRRLTPVVRLAPAKLNLTLAVLGRRADGFHALHSVMAPLALADRLSLVPTTGAADRLHVSGAGLDTGPDNLVLRAVAAARAGLGGTLGPPGSRGDPRPFLAPLAIRLDKRIPVAAGLGGGSSDAAAALDGALEAWGVALSAADRTSAAAALGSDVPFFLAGGFALATGRGEVVTPLPAPTGAPPGLLVVAPAIAVATPRVYAAHAAGARPGHGSTRLASEHLAAELRSGLSSARLLERAAILASANDLVPATAAVAPELVPFRRALTRLLARPVGQSGSGPALWVLYPSPAAADAAAARVREALDAGLLPAPGAAPPTVISTAFAVPPAEAPEDRPE